jgi:hypothetical protein
MGSAGRSKHIFFSSRLVSWQEDRSQIQETEIVYGNEVQAYFEEAEQQEDDSPTTFW